ncbi:helix-turn-helix transcriptional regulator [Gloeocapsa sp. BRSZ]
MISLLPKSPYPSSGTSASGSMRYSVPHRPNVVTVPVFPTFFGTATNEPISDQDLLLVLERTNSGLPLSLQSANATEANRAALNELRKLSGLTWEQLAKLFNVSRRSLHFWASGQPLSRFNEENLNRLLGTIRYINRGSASINRKLLLSPSRDSRLFLDLLIAGEHEQVKQILGPGNAPTKPQLVPLSKDASMSRMPLPPEDLVDALQEPIHREVGRSRPARAARSRKHGS